MKESQATNALGSLSNETRLRIIRYLVAAGPNGAPAGVIGDAVKAAPSKISFHMSTLENAGLVKSKKVSRHVMYRADCKKIGELLNYLMNDCCAADPTVVSCCAPSSNQNCCD